MELHGKYVFIGRGRARLAGQAAAGEVRPQRARPTPQKYGIGIKELWQVPDESSSPAWCSTPLGWPLDDKTGGGSFMYHFGTTTWPSATWCT